MSKPFGRPPKYSKDILVQAEKYLKESEDEYKRIMFKGKKRKSYREEFQVNIPSVEGLAYYLKVSKETLYQWEETFDDFSDVMAILRAKQAKELLSKGLSGRYNSTIAKLILVKHGYRDATELSGPNGKDLIPTKELLDEGRKALGTYFNDKSTRNSRKQ